MVGAMRPPFLLYVGDSMQIVHPDRNVNLLLIFVTFVTLNFS